jgi:hypothetical protein
VKRTLRSTVCGGYPAVAAPTCCVSQTQESPLKARFSGNSAPEHPFFGAIWRTENILRRSAGLGGQPLRAGIPCFYHICCGWEEGRESASVTDIIRVNTDEANGSEQLVVYPNLRGQPVVDVETTTNLGTIDIMLIIIHVKVKQVNRSSSDLQPHGVLN